MLVPSFLGVQYTVQFVLNYAEVLAHTQTCQNPEYISGSAGFYTRQRQYRGLSAPMGLDKVINLKPSRTITSVFVAPVDVFLRAMPIFPSCWVKPGTRYVGPSPLKQRFSSVQSNVSAARIPHSLLDYLNVFDSILQRKSYNLGCRC